MFVRQLFVTVEKCTKLYCYILSSVERDIIDREKAETSFVTSLKQSELNFKMP